MGEVIRKGAAADAIFSDARSKRGQYGELQGPVQQRSTKMTFEYRAERGRLARISQGRN